MDGRRLTTTLEVGFLLGFLAGVALGFLLWGIRIAPVIGATPTPTIAVMITTPTIGETRLPSPSSTPTATEPVDVLPTRGPSSTPVPTHTSQADCDAAVMLWITQGIMAIPHDCAVPTPSIVPTPTVVIQKG